MERRPEQPTGGGGMGETKGWRVEVVRKDAAGREWMLTKYKPFRLTALRVDPAAFSSTLAREEAFDDAVWLSRLTQPSNNLVVAIDDESQDVLCAAFLRELPPSSVEDHSPSSPPPSTLLFGIYGLWTLPSARRKGIALRVLSETTRLAGDIVEAAGKEEGRLEVEAYKENREAMRLYPKAGFAVAEEPESDFVKLYATVRRNQRPSYMRQS